jgi:hypothetical protein
MDLRLSKTFLVMLTIIMSPMCQLRLGLGRQCATLQRYAMSVNAGTVPWPVHWCPGPIQSICSVLTSRFPAALPWRITGDSDGVSAPCLMAWLHRRGQYLDPSTFHSLRFCSPNKCLICAIDQIHNTSTCIAGNLQPICSGWELLPEGARSKVRIRALVLWCRWRS